MISLRFNSLNASVIVLRKAPGIVGYRTAHLRLASQTRYHRTSAGNEEMYTEFLLLYYIFLYEHHKRRGALD